jgi:hypothetical protein
VYADSTYQWQVGQPSATTVAGLDCGNGGTICQPAGITVSNSAFQVGYAWRASGLDRPLDVPGSTPYNGQEFVLQNLSVLANPSSALMQSSIGLTDQPLIAYDPTPSQIVQPNNFVLDPRNGSFMLRDVALGDGAGNDFGLSADPLMSWGRFHLPTFDALAVHPSGAVIGVSWQYHKMEILQLPAQAVPDAQAPDAQMVSGQGVRQGLLQGPRARAVTPDGRILVLETINQRVQAFDTNGNPAPSFSAGQVFSLTPDAGTVAALNSQTLPDTIQQGFQNAYLTYVLTLDSSLTTELDSGTLQATDDPIINAFTTVGITLCYDPARMDDPTVSTYITVQTAGSAWTITDPQQGTSYQVSNQDGSLSVFRIITQYSISVVSKDTEWLLVDTVTTATYILEASTLLTVSSSSSYFDLYNPTNETLLYLDMAVEAQGVIYVLSYQGNGSSPSDYYLDLYNADGTFIVRTPDPNVTSTPQNVVAAKLCVDMWRNVYTLDYQAQSGRPEPTVSHWIPTPPLFSLPAADEPAFEHDNISVVQQYFQQQNITLGSSAYVTTVSPGYYQVHNPPTLYEVFRAGNELQVYTIPL